MIYIGDSFFIESCGEKLIQEIRKPSNKMIKEWKEYAKSGEKGKKIDDRGGIIIDSLLGNKYRHDYSHRNACILRFVS